GRPRGRSGAGAAFGSPPRSIAVAAAASAAAVSAASAPPPTVAPAAARAVLPGLGLVDGQVAAPDLLAVEGRDGLVPTAGHLDEADPARPAGLGVADDLGAGDRAVLAEPLDQVVRRHLEGQVADVDVLAHGHPLRARRPAVAETRTRGLRAAEERS